jgi:hypothetical protein
MDILFYFFLTYFLFDMTPEQKEFQAKYERLREIFKTNPALNKDLDASTVELLKKAKTHYQKLQADENPSDGMVQKVAYTAPPPIKRAKFIDAIQYAVNEVLLKSLDDLKSNKPLDIPTLLSNIEIHFSPSCPIALEIKAMFIETTKASKGLTEGGYAKICASKLPAMVTKKNLAEHYAKHKAKYKADVVEEEVDEVKILILVDADYIKKSIPKDSSFITKSAVDHTDPTTKKKGTYVTNIIAGLQAAEAELGATDLYASIPFADATLRADLKNRLNNILSGLGDAIISHKGFEISTYKISRETIIAEVDAFCKDKKYIEAVYDKANPAADIPPTISSNFFVNCFANKKHQIIPENSKGITLAQYRSVRGEWLKRLSDAETKLRPAGLDTEMGDAGLLLIDKAMLRRAIYQPSQAFYTSLPANYSLIEHFVSKASKASTVNEAINAYTTAISYLGAGSEEEYNMYLLGLGGGFTDTTIFISPDVFAAAFNSAIVRASEAAYMQKMNNWAKEVSKLAENFQKNYPWCDKLYKNKLQSSLKNVFKNDFAFIGVIFEKFVGEIATKEDTLVNLAEEQGYDQLKRAWSNSLNGLVGELPKNYAALLEKYKDNPKKIEYLLNDTFALPTRDQLHQAIFSAFKEEGKATLPPIGTNFEMRFTLRREINGGTQNLGAFFASIPLKYQWYRLDTSTNKNIPLVFVIPSELPNISFSKIGNGEDVADISPEVQSWVENFDEDTRTVTHTLGVKLIVQMTGLSFSAGSTIPVIGGPEASVSTENAGLRVERLAEIRIVSRYVGDNFSCVQQIILLPNQFGGNRGMPVDLEGIQLSTQAFNEVEALNK